MSHTSLPSYPHLSQFFHPRRASGESAPETWPPPRRSHPCRDGSVAASLSSMSPPPPCSTPVSSSAAAEEAADESRVADLLLLEPHHMPSPDYLRRCRRRPLHITARHDSISWILQVHSHYRFRPVTAMLAVNYLDRFLSSNALLEDADLWPFQLLSVASLALAAKMEEPHAPPLLDLQLFQPRFVFEPGTVRRMELLVMAALDWRLRSVTPFDYLPLFISRLSSSSHRSSDHEASARFESRTSNLILSTARVVDFLAFPPSAIAAAAVLCAAADCTVSPATWKEEQLQANGDMVRSCLRLMEEYLIDTCPQAELEGSRVEPPSPDGVLDAAACGSCDTRSAGTEPPSKRPRSSPPRVRRE